MEEGGRGAAEGAGHSRVRQGQEGGRGLAEGASHSGVWQGQEGGRGAAVLREAYKEMLLQQQGRHRNELERRQAKYQRQLDAQVWSSWRTQHKLGTFGIVLNIVLYIGFWHYIAYWGTLMHNRICFVRASFLFGRQGRI